MLTDGTKRFIQAYVGVHENGMSSLSERAFSQARLRTQAADTASPVILVTWEIAHAHVGAVGDATLRGAHAEGGEGLRKCRMRQDSSSRRDIRHKRGSPHGKRGSPQEADLPSDVQRRGGIRCERPEGAEKREAGVERDVIDASRDPPGLLRRGWRRLWWHRRHWWDWWQPGRIWRARREAWQGWRAQWWRGTGRGRWRRRERRRVRSSRREGQKVGRADGVLEMASAVRRCGGYILDPKGGGA